MVAGKRENSRLADGNVHHACCTAVYRKRAELMAAFLLCNSLDHRNSGVVSAVLFLSFVLLSLGCLYSVDEPNLVNGRFQLKMRLRPNGSNPDLGGVGLSEKGMVGDLGCSNGQVGMITSESDSSLDPWKSYKTEVGRARDRDWVGKGQSRPSDTCGSKASSLSEVGESFQTWSKGR